MPFPLEEKYVIETEKELGVIFPELFRQKMMKENGGEAATEEDQWGLIPFADKSDDKRISRTCNDIIYELEKARNWRNFPNKAIAIAMNGFGDYMILIPQANDSVKLKEELYMWFHETGEIHKIAESINEVKIL